MTHVFNAVSIEDRLYGDGINLRTPVRVATTTSGTLASDFEDGDTVDGVVLSTGDRILIKDQASSSENGVYVVEASGAPTLDSDFESGEVVDGLTIWVKEGTANTNTAWVGSGTVGTNATFDRYDVSDTLAVDRGGTGFSSYTIGDILYASSSSALSQLGVVANSVLTTNNSSTIDWRNDVHLNDILDPSNPTLEILSLSGVASAVNELTITNAATGNDPSISATGDDANIGIDIITKGTGVVSISSASGSSVGEIRLEDNTGGQYVGIDAPATVSSSYTLTLPTAVGTTGQIITLADNAGTLQFSANTMTRDFPITTTFITLSSATFTNFAVFAWDDSDFSSATTRTLTFHYISSPTRTGELQIFNFTTSSVEDTFISGTDFTDTDGIKTVTFANIGSDAALVFRARKSAPGGTNPILSGLRLNII